MTTNASELIAQSNQLYEQAKEMLLSGDAEKKANVQGVLTEAESLKTQAAQLQDIERKLSEGGDAVSLWGDGRATRDLLYVADCAEACVRALDCPEQGPVMQGGPINLGTGQETTVFDLAATIAAKMEFKGRIEWDASHPVGRDRCCMNIDRARALLDWQPRTSLSPGLAATICDYRARYGHAR
jgi:GDP-L-fucose synthase